MALTPWQKTLLEPYNMVAERIAARSRTKTEWGLLREVLERAERRTDIASHLPRIFLETVSASPRLIVELGVKHGQSTFALSRAAMATGAKLVSCDIRDWSSSSEWKEWEFVHMDDIQFAKKFPAWCEERGIRPVIDVLFIDTSHEYEHTKQEIAAFFPYLAPRAKVIFHDTNCAGWYVRSNLTVDRSYDSQRGVIRAIEDHLGRSLDERSHFIEFVNGWIVENDPRCNGLLIMSRG